MNKFKILIAALIGELIKLKYRIYTPSFQNALNVDGCRKEKIIVSLTSYGRRIHDVLPFAIYSLLRQTYKPDKILLWLDENIKYVDLPDRIKKLKSSNLIEIRYCQDIRSYKKLIPSIIDYPDAIIITYDDDLFYKKDSIQRLMVAHEAAPNCVITHRAHRVGLFQNTVLEYGKWEQCISGERGEDVFPTGGAGCLYKREWLHGDVTRDDIFMKICPLADDVWFFFMEVLKGTKRMVLERKGYVYIPLDDLYQYFHKHSSLASQNEQESKNDVQIRDVMKYYSLTVKDGEIVLL